MFIKMYEDSLTGVKCGVLVLRGPKNLLCASIIKQLFVMVIFKHTNNSTGLSLWKFYRKYKKSFNDEKKSVKDVIELKGTTYCLHAKKRINGCRTRYTYACSVRTPIITIMIIMTMIAMIIVIVLENCFIIIIIIINVIIIIGSSTYTLVVSSIIIASTL